MREREFGTRPTSIERRSLRETRGDNLEQFRGEEGVLELKDEGLEGGDSDTEEDDDVALKEPVKTRQWQVESRSVQISV